MAISTTRQTVLQIVNEVRRLIGHGIVTRLDQDRYSTILMRMLNTTIAEISDYGDWQEMFNEVEVTSDVTSTFSIGIAHPLQRVYEISVSGQRQALYPTTIEHINQLQRGNVTGGLVRFYALKGVDTHGNPKFTVHPVPNTAAASNPFTVTYFKKEALYDITSADDDVPFPANVCIAGLYMRALVEESGGAWTKEALQANQEFKMLMDEALKRFNSDTGVDIRVQPKPYYQRG